MKNELLFIMLLSLFLIFISMMGTISAANWTVNPGDSIQSIINNASSNDTIIVNDNYGSGYTYTENVVVNKTVQLKVNDGGNVTIQALNSSQPIFTVNAFGNSTKIQNFKITGATDSSGIYLDGTSNCIINGNSLTGNQYGIRSSNNKNNILYQSTITSNQHGIDLYNSTDNLLYQNSITSNQYGIYLSNSSADINFNRIFGNSEYGLYNAGNGTVNATNNWWGSNNPIVSSNIGSDICIAGGTVIYDPWLVLNLIGSVIHVTPDSSSSSEITADLTHDNHGADTSSSGTLPEGILINFITTLGTIDNSATTRRGKAVVTLTSCINSSATTVSAILDNQTASKAFHNSFNSIGAAVNDPLTSNGDIIIVGNGTYNENVVINKNLTIISEGNVTVHAINSSISVFTINSGGNGSLIQGFTIMGANLANSFQYLSPAGILLASANNCTVLDNTIKNNVYGIYLLDSSYNEIIGNIIENNEQGIIIPNACESLEGWLVSNSNPEGEELQYWVHQYYQYFFGIGSNSIFNNITDNKIRNNTYHGIYSTGELSSLGYNQLISNDITGNAIGIFCGESAVIKAHFNRIAGNNLTGFCMAVGNTNTDVSNNWWGSNNPKMILNSTGDYINADFCYIGRYPGTEYYQWLPSNWILEKFAPIIVLNIRPTSYKVSNGKCDESIITADLNYNSNGECISSKGHIPDGISIYFRTNSGIITNIGYTLKGTVTSNLTLDQNLQSGITSITANLDNQNVSTQVDRIAKVNITIFSTAIDLSTNQPLLFTYEIPLNESVSWVSVLWKTKEAEFGNFSQIGIFEVEVDLIVNGKIVVTKNVANEKYLHYKNYSYNPHIFNDINIINKIFSKTSTSGLSLESMFYLSCFLNESSLNHLKNLTGTQLEEALINEFRIINSFTDEEFALLKNHTLFTDFIGVDMSYTGNAGPIIELPSSNENQIKELPFSGNYISRLSKITYWNGAYLDTDTNGMYFFKPGGYEGVRSFAIVTTKVTDEILQYWLEQKDKKNINGTYIYLAGPMKAAYGTFLTSLIMIKCHDMVADQAAAKLNVTWSRTSPIAVSVCDNAYECYMTLECDHSFGMTVTGDPGNVWAFRFACSSAINPIEYLVMKTLFPVANSSGNNSSFEDSVYLEHLYSSITLGLGQMILNGEMPDILMSDSYLIMCRDGKFLVLDHETGILRDAMIIDLEFMNSAYCFSDLQTEWAFDLGEELNSINPDTWPEQLQSINNVTIALSSIAAVLGNVVYEGSAIAGAEFLGPIMLIIAPLAFLDAIQPYAIQEAEQNGDFNLADYLKNNNLMDQVWDILTSHGPPQGVWDESYGYSNPNVQRNLEDIKNLKEGALSIWNEISGFAISHPDQLFDKRHNPMSESYWENYFREHNIKSMRNAEQQITESILNVVGGDKYDEVGQVIDALARDAGKRIASGVSKYQVGNIASGTLDVAVALVEIHWALLLKIAYP